MPCLKPSFRGVPAACWWTWEASSGSEARPFLGGIVGATRVEEPPSRVIVLNSAVPLHHCPVGEAGSLRVIPLGTGRIFSRALMCS